MSTELQTQDLPVVTNIDRPMSVHEVMNQSITIHEILTRVMVDGIHYGVIPGTDKPTLYQAGAEKICATFRLAPKYEVDDLCDPRENIYRYRVKCSLYTIRDGMFVGSAVGEASSAEEKYQWERAVCQKHWDTTDPSRRRIKFRKVKDSQEGFDEVLQVQRNCADLANTVLKIAVKRSFTSAAKGATAASDILDVDLDEEPVAALHREEKKDRPKQKAKAKPAPKLAFGRSKGKSLDDESVPLDDLNWMLDYICKNVGSDKRKAYEKQDREMMELLQAEIDKRSGGQPKADVMTDQEWTDFCALNFSTHEEQYTQASLDFKTNDPSVLPQEKRIAFQKHLNVLVSLALMK